MMALTPCLPPTPPRCHPEQKLSKRERTRNQTALPGWASRDAEHGLGGKRQRADPRAGGGLWASLGTAPRLGDSPARTPQSFSGAQGTSWHGAGCGRGKNGSRGAEESAGLEPMACFPPPFSGLHCLLNGE